MVSLEQGLAALARLPKTREWLERELDMCLDLRNSLWLLGDQTRIAECLGQAQRVAEGLDDPIAQARVLALSCNHLTFAGDLLRAVEARERAVRLSAGVAPDVERLACFHLAATHRCRGEFRQAIELYRRVIESLRDDQPPGRFSNGLPAVVARVWAGWAQTDLGAFDEARHLCAEGVRIAEKGDHAFSITLAHLGAGYVAASR